MSEPGSTADFPDPPPTSGDAGGDPQAGGDPKPSVIEDGDLLGALLENLPDSIYFKDRESRFLKISVALAAKFGMTSPGDITGRTDADLFSAEHAEAARRDELRIMRSGKPVVDQVERETWTDRDDTWCLTTKMPLRSKSGEIIGTFGISRDITELKQSQDALRQALEAADTANRAKSDFLANMSHEIRTPMNAIIGLSELLTQTPLLPEQQDHLRLVRQSASSLLNLINDILDFSKIEARKLELESIDFSIREVVGRCCQTLAIKADDKGLELACRIAPDVPDALRGDPGRVRQVLTNLIGNAIKFTEQGEIVVDVTRDTESPQPLVAGPGPPTVPIRIAVRDTGIGIPSEKQHDVLKAFTQADASTTRRYGGTGLGLAISRQLVELMSGHMTLESRPGVGTTFTFFLPLRSAATDQFSDTSAQCIDSSAFRRAADRLSALAGFRVLVVDDNQTNLRILDEILASWRVACDCVASGPEAVERIFAAIDGGRPYRLVLLDCMMPDMDGFGVAEAIRKGRADAAVKLIMLSSAARADGAKRCRELGVARLLTKPVLQSELLETILQVMDLGSIDKRPPDSGDAVASDTGDAAANRSLNVLVAEDGAANQQVALGLLSAAGHRATLAVDGRDAIKKWSEQDFDLILMDMHMPEMDGLEATRHIRHRESASGAHIPIIALTAAAMNDDAHACLQAGMDAHVAKPIVPNVLESTIQQWCCPESPPVGSAGETNPPSSQGTQQAVAPESLIDFEQARRNIPGGDETVRRIAEVFRIEASDLIDQIRTASEQKDVKTIKRCAHTVKSSASLFGAGELKHAAERVESRREDGDDLDLRRRIEELEAAFRRIAPWLDRFANQ